MPEMLIEYKGGEANRQRAVDMVTVAAAHAAQRFGKEVVWKARAFEDTEGEPDFLITTQITDNDDEYVKVCDEVQALVLDMMAIHAYHDEQVEHWVQRVKGKWGQQSGRVVRR